MPVFDSSTSMLILVALLAYGLGSIPFGLVTARVFGLGDLRQIGSGNIGATNVLRTGSKKAAFLTLLGDGGKAVVAVLLARAILGEDGAQVAGLFAVLGHMFPVWLGFRGGKGVATLLGAVLALSFPVGLGACAIWLVIAAIFRMSSLAALAAAGLAPVVAVVMGYGQGFILLVALAVLIYVKHRANIRRLIAGTEPKIGQKASDTPDAA